jgi:sortase A
VGSFIGAQVCHARVFACDPARPRPRIPVASGMIRNVRRLLRILATALITAGLVVLADVGLTLAWKEPISTLYGEIRQGQAAQELDDLNEEFVDRAELRRLEHERFRERLPALAARFAREVEPGTGVARLRIPRIGLDAVVIEGTDAAALQKGPGHYTRAADPAYRRAGDGSAFPGQGRTVGIAGHRTTYLAPFRRINELEPSDEIVLELPYGEFTYEVEDTRIVSPTAVEVVRNTSRERLVLTACHPLYSATERIVVTAGLERARPPRD